MFSKTDTFKGMEIKNQKNSDHFDIKILIEIDFESQI